MSQPMLSINDCPSKKKAIANLLPCRLSHNGPVPLSSSLWAPSKDSDVQKAFFRGRKLCGKALPIPSTHKGLIVERKIETAGPMPDIVSEDEMEPERGRMEVLAGFKEVIVWHHEGLADAMDDEYVRGVEEWIDMAAKIHEFSNKSKAD